MFARNTAVREARCGWKRIHGTDGLQLQINRSCERRCSQHIGIKGSHHGLVFEVSSAVDVRSCACCSRCDRAAAAFDHAGGRRRKSAGTDKGRPLLDCSVLCTAAKLLWCNRGSGGDAPGCVEEEVASPDR